MLNKERQGSIANAMLAEVPGGINDLACAS